MRSLLLFVCLLWPGWAALAQAIYYVDGTQGLDTNPGTSLALPWRTLQKASDAATPGSTVLIRGGTYHENVVVHVSGTASQPIRFQPYQREAVLLDGTGTAGLTLLRVSNQSHLRFERLTLQNLTGNGAQGVLVETTGTTAATDLTFTGLTIQGIRWTTNPTTTPGAGDNAQGFIAYGRQGGLTGLTLDSCEVSGNVLGYSEALTLDGNVAGFLIRRCRVHDNTNIGIDLAGHYGVSPDPATDQARNGLVQANECYRNVSPYATAGGIYVDGGRDIILDGNRSYENGWGIEVGAEENGTVSGIAVTNNLLYRNQQAGLALGGYTTATSGQVVASEVRNNTFLENNTLQDGTGELALTKFSTCRLVNNIFYTNAQGVLLTAEAIAPQAGNVLDYNRWYTPAGNPGQLTVNWRGTSYASFAAYQAGTGQESHSGYADPGLVAPTQRPTPDAHLLPTSPARAAADPATTPRAGETDLDGHPRPIGLRLDGGALAYVAAALATAPGQLPTEGLVLYPVPTRQDFVQLRVPFARYEVALYDSQGQLLLRQASSPKQLSLERMPTGVYFLRVTAVDGQVLTQRLVKE